MKYIKVAYLSLIIISWMFFLTNNNKPNSDNTFLFINLGANLLYGFNYLFKNKINNKSVLVFFIMFLSAISVMINSSGYGKLMITINSLLMIAIMNDFKNFNLKSIFLIFSLFMMLTSVKTYSEISSNIGLDYTLNSNTMGILMFVNIAIVINELILAGRTRVKILLLTLLFVFVGYLIYYNSRTSFLGVILFLILSIINKNITKKTLFIAIISTIIIPVLYLIFEEYFSNVVIFNKNLYSGRNHIWRESLKVIQKNLLFGTGTTFTFGEGLYTHNSSLGVIQSFGVIVYILILFMFLGIKSKSNFFNRYFFTIVLMSTFEDVFFSIYLYIPIIIGIYVINNQNIKFENENLLVKA